MGWRGLTPSFKEREFPTKWTKIQYLGTHDMSSPTMIEDWRFFPSGRAAVGLEWAPNGKFYLLFLDVHNKLWFTHLLDDSLFKYDDIFTYHMLNEDTVVVIEMEKYYEVKQHIFKIDMEKRTAVFNETKQYDFLPRDAEKDQPNWKRRLWFLPLDKHVHVTLNSKHYTALVSDRIFGFAEKRKIVYLVPWNPFHSNNIEPMEFSFIPTFNSVNGARLNQIIAGIIRHYDNRSFGFAGADSTFQLLQFSPVINGNMLEGAFLTVDLSKLINIYDKPNEAMEHRTRDIQQAAAFDFIIYPCLKISRNKVCFSSGLDGTLVMYQKDENILRCYSWEESQESLDIRLHFSGSNSLIETKTSVHSWLTTHPCGAVLQFYMEPTRIEEIYVRVVSIYRNTLQSRISAKLIFEEPDSRKIDSMKPVHRIVFHGEAAIKLDEATKENLKK